MASWWSLCPDIQKKSGQVPPLLLSRQATKHWVICKANPSENLNIKTRNLYYWNSTINQSNPVLLKERVRIPRTRHAGGAAMLWGRLPLDGVGSCRLFFTDDFHNNLSWVPASDKPHTFKSCFTHSSQVFFGRPGPFLPGTGLDLTLFISPLERMTCPNHLSRRSRTRMARSHISSLACSSSIDGSSDGLTPQIQRIIARLLRHSRWRAAEVMGQVSVPCNIELRTLELNRRPLRSKGTGLDVSKGRFSRNLPQAHLHLAVAAAITSTEHVTQVAETINRLEHTVTNLNLLERAAIDRAYTRHTTTTRAFIGQVLGKCFEARAFLIMNPQVAFGAPDGWPAYSRTTHGTWELAGVLQGIQPKPRSHEHKFQELKLKEFEMQWENS